MVIDDTQDCKIIPLIPKQHDEMSIITANYESFMYYCNILESLLSGCNKSINSIRLILPLVEDYLETISTFSGNIHQQIPNALKKFHESIDKINLISNNIVNKTNEIERKVKFLQNEIIDMNKEGNVYNNQHLSKQVNELVEKVDVIKEISKEINCNISKEIIRKNERIKIEEDVTVRVVEFVNSETDVGSFVSALCIGVFVILILVVSYHKVMNKTE